MFKKVRWRLTLINIAVVGVILLLFLSGIYVLMKQDTDRRSEQLIHALAADLRMKAPRRAISPPSARLWNNSFYVRYNSDSTLRDMSANIPLTESDISALIDGALLNKKDMGVIKLQSVPYRFYKSLSADIQEMTIVYMNIQQDRDTLARLITTLILVGLAGILIVFVSSLFLAGRALIPIRKSWERQQNFVADASHELRSPLAVMQTNLELVMGNREETVESQSKWLENVQIENRRMTKLVTDLLFLARADSNQQMLERALFTLDEVVHEVIDSFEPLAAKKGIQLEMKLDQESELFGDADRLKQLTVILLDNAIKYTPQGGKTEVSLKKRDSYIELIVSDTGVGIGSEHLDKIFDRFYRVDKARSRDIGGTGLGLSIAEWIVKQHRGSIQVSSVPGAGSTFKVLLPKTLQKG
jgi:two-component system sensor histidine kinase CiaH